MKIDRAGRISELDRGFGEAAADAQVDRLLNIHIPDVVGNLDKIHDLKVVSTFSKSFEMGAVETSIFLLLNNPPNHLRYRFQLIRRRLIEDSEAKDDTAFLHPLEVADAAIEQIGIRED